MIKGGQIYIKKKKDFAIFEAVEIAEIH